MKRLAFVFKTSPHGNSAGREGLDALLAASAFTEDLGVFFIGDGVLNLLPNQQPNRILARDYISTFKILPLYDIDAIFVCATSLQERGIGVDTSWNVDAQLVAPSQISAKLNQFDVILTF